MEDNKNKNQKEKKMMEELPLEEMDDVSGGNGISSGVIKLGKIVSDMLTGKKNGKH